MIELKNDTLVFTFPKVHPGATLSITFHRTLRIPDDGKTYPLPPGLGSFPLRHVDDFSGMIPASWVEHGGVMLPMYQSEAMWLSFRSDYIDLRGVYPFAVRIATGKIDAITGEPWSGMGLAKTDDHLVVPEQPWLDGYCFEKGMIRQFVAMPLGAGYSVEEQLTGEAEHGGLQIVVYPMKREAFERHFPKDDEDRSGMDLCCAMESAAPEMGLAPGGMMRQEIYEDPYKLAEWDQEAGSRCFTHIANSMVWRAITGQSPPTVPPTAEEYTRAGMPWFDYYDDKHAAIDGAETFKTVKSVVEMGKDKGDMPLPENQSVTPEQIVALRAGLRKGQVREWTD